MKVGSLVECVVNTDDTTRRRYSGVTFPDNGSIYTVRDIHPDGDCIRLEEIVNPIGDYIEGRDEPYFAIKLFRELQPPMDLSELIEECQTQTIEP